jgi:hypothetical protein
MRRARCARCKKVWEDESSLKKVLENRTLIKGILGDRAPATSGMICDRFPHVPPTRRPILGRTSAWNDSRRRRRRDSPAIPERTSLVAASLGYQLWFCARPWLRSSNQHMNVLHLIGLAALGISLAHHLALLVCERCATCHHDWALAT